MQPDHRRILESLLTGPRVHDPRLAFYDRDTKHIWEMVRLGLIWFYMGSDASNTPGGWHVRLTDRARSALAEGGDYSPDDSHGYLAQLRTDVPNLDVITAAYVREALLAFEGDLYLSATVMIGTAAEKAFLDMLEGFRRHLQGKQLDDMDESIEKISVLAKVLTFRKLMTNRMHLLPETQRDDFEGLFAGVQRTIRIARNEAGHPTGKLPSRLTCHGNLLLAAGFIKDLYAMKAHFEATPP